MDAVSELDKEEPPELEEKGEPPELEEEPPEEKNNNAAAVLASSSSSSAPAVRPWPAAVAERYERREWLGKGMFGDVYKAWDRVLERDVAVKCLSGRTDERFVAAPLPYFEREVKSLEACRGHPNVVQLLDTFSDSSRADGDRFVVTEYAGPMNLCTYIRRRRSSVEPFFEDEVREVMEQLLAGAAHAHAAGVLHRDIVPENVIVNFDLATGRMVYKICGFGMAAARADEKDDFGKVACANPYRAPELFFEGSKDYNDRVDTWSLGCIMAELITGNGKPFFSAPYAEVFRNMLHVVGTKGIVMWKVASLWKTGRRVRGNLKNIVMWKVASLWNTSHSNSKTGRREEEERGNLKKKFPPWILSPAGFKVLKGLLHSNADRRLSAAAALRKPWFQTSDDDDGTVSS